MCTAWSPVGETGVEPDSGTLPMPLMLTVVAFCVFHESVADLTRRDLRRIGDEEQDGHRCVGDWWSPAREPCPCRPGCPLPSTGKYRIALAVAGKEVMALVGTGKRDRRSGLLHPLVGDRQPVRRIRAGAVQRDGTRGHADLIRTRVRDSERYGPLRTCASALHTARAERPPESGCVAARNSLGRSELPNCNADRGPLVVLGADDGRVDAAFTSKRDLLIQREDQAQRAAEAVAIERSSSEIRRCLPRSYCPTGRRTRWRRPGSPPAGNAG